MIACTEAIGLSATSAELLYIEKRKASLMEIPIMGLEAPLQSNDNT
ncbi:MAG: hypothetical protein KDH96_06920 [Candidatus Riesia sp.]|nr:hypothetical protein [Candidatus Riesia sp.]